MTNSCSVTLTHVGSWAVSLMLALTGACSTPTVNLTTRVPEDAGANNDAGPGADAGLASNEAGIVLCGSAPCACSNGIDDDLDGLVDGFDPECSAPFDNDEATFGVGVHGDNPKAKCRDCFFDGNSGSGDDGCDVAASCSTDGVATGGACRTCEPSEQCKNSCLPRVPNGCDCFGCCEVRDASGVANVLLRDTCSAAHRDDPTACQSCVLSLGCFNPCEACELCAGKTPADLPAECGQPAQYTCEGGTVCTENAACVAGSYCVQGCCIPALP